MNKQTVEATDVLVKLLTEDKKELETLIELLTEAATRPSSQRPNVEPLSKGTRKVGGTKGEKPVRIDAAIVPMLKENGPMSIDEIADNLVKLGFDFKGKAPHRSVATSLSRSYKFMRRNTKYMAKQRMARKRRKGRRTQQ